MMSSSSPSSIDRLHIRILECLSEDHYFHSNEIYGWVAGDYPNPAIFLRHLEDLIGWGYIEFEFDRGYRRTRLGSRVAKEYREAMA